MAELLGNTPRLAIGLMPHGAVGFEQTFIRLEVFRAKAGIEVVGILPNKGDKALAYAMRSYRIVPPVG